MDKKDKVTTKLVVDINDSQLDLKTVDTLYSCLNYLANLGEPYGPRVIPFIGEMVRRLLDCWAVGDDPDPGLPFPTGFWNHWTFPKHFLAEVGLLRMKWATFDPLFKHTCSCGGYRYAIGHGLWITAAWTWYICTGCNTFKSELTVKGDKLFQHFGASPARVYSYQRREKKEYDPSDVINLIRVLGMRKHLQALIDETALDAMYADEDEEESE